jgi:hypothetical protein
MNDCNECVFIAIDVKKTKKKKKQKSKPSDDDDEQEEEANNNNNDDDDDDDGRRRIRLTAMLQCKMHHGEDLRVLKGAAVDHIELRFDPISLQALGAPLIDANY